MRTKGSRFGPTSRACSDAGPGLVSPVASGAALLLLLFLRPPQLVQLLVVLVVVLVTIRFFPLEITIFLFCSLKRSKLSSG